MTEDMTDGPVTLTFVVPFVAGQHRPRLSTRPFPHAVKADADRSREAEVRAAFDAAMDEMGLAAPLAPKGVPVTLSIRTERPLPKSTPRRVGSAPDVCKPDADNVAKLVMDALNGRAYLDDSQVTCLHVTKRPRARGEAATTVEVFVGGR